MQDYVLIDGDKAIFDAAFGVAMVVTSDGELKGQGPATLGGKKLCIAGDEKSVKVENCPYTTPIHSIPGKGTLEIAALGGDQTASKTKSGDTLVLLLGTIFTAKFTVTSPAKKPPPPPGPPVDDATPMYSGSGMFLTTNTKFRGY
jgi:hypothetical protein